MELGVKIAKHLKPGDIVCLFGALGSGKTTLVKGLARGLKIRENMIHSPTFVLLNEYQGRVPLYHFDLYRLEQLTEILSLGYEEFFYGQGIAVVEWAEKLGRLLPTEYLKIELFHKRLNNRVIKIAGQGTHFKGILKTLQEDIKEISLK